MSSASIMARANPKTIAPEPQAGSQQLIKPCRATSSLESPDDIKQNTVEMSFTTIDFSNVPIGINAVGKTTPVDEVIYERLNYSARTGTLLQNASVKEHIENRNNFTNEKDCDFILVSEWVFEDRFSAIEAQTDADIVGGICYSLWASGRYFMRIRVLNANLTDEDMVSLDSHIDEVLSDGWFYGGRFWKNP